MLSGPRWDSLQSLHYVGTGVAFTAGLLFVCLHCALSYHGAHGPQDLAVAYLRIVLATIAFVTLITQYPSRMGWPRTPPVAQTLYHPGCWGIGGGTDTPAQSGLLPPTPGR